MRDRANTEEDRLGNELRIIGFRVRNILRCSAVDMRFHEEGGLVEFYGPNESGKSSAINSIYLAFRDILQLPADPIHEDEKEGKVEIDLRNDFGVDILLTFRIWRTRRGAIANKLEVAPVGETAISSPFETLQKFFNGTSLDIRGFLEAKGPKRREMLLRAAGVDFTEIDAERDSIFNERTNANRDLKKLEAQLSSIERPDPETPDEEQSASDLVAKKDAIDERISERNSLAGRIDERKTDIGSKVEEIDDLKRKLEIAKTALGDLEQKQKADIERLGEFEPIEDLEYQRDTLKGKIGTLDAVNRAVRNKHDYERLVADVRAKKAESENLTKKIEDIDHQKRDALANANLPIRGLEVTGDDVLYNGRPFDQASHANMLSIAIAVKIAENPKARFVLIPNGDGFDKKSRERLRKIAREQKVLILHEIASSEPGDAVAVFEDGHATFDYRNAGVAAGSEDGVEGKTSPPAPSENVTSDRN